MAAKEKIVNAKKNKRNFLSNLGFTMMETVIVIAVLSIILGVAAVGIIGYIETSEELERSEVVETAFYSLQSHINYLKRNGKLDEFEEELKDYNKSQYGNEHILTIDQNRTIIELNYEGDNATSYYENEYYPAHKSNEIIYISLDKVLESRKNNSIYKILESALKNEGVMENSFLVEYDLTTNVVRSVFYSQVADTLGFSFNNVDNAKENKTDCILRDENSLSKKKQGYYGVFATSVVYEEINGYVSVPDEPYLVNGDRLYLTWPENNVDNPYFIDGTYNVEQLSYVITLYNQDNNKVATYNIAREDMYVDTTGTANGVLGYLDDFSEGLPDEETSGKMAWCGFTDMSYENSPDGVSGQRYYLLLECLHHQFDENGYALSPHDTLYATVEVEYEGLGIIESDGDSSSNVESAYYAYVGNEDGVEEYGIGCSRHLWNVRKGNYTKDYRLVSDVDWANIEQRGCDIEYTSILFDDEEIQGFKRSFEGTFDGKKSGEDSSDTQYDCYKISGIRQYEPTNYQVGLFAVNNGKITNIILDDYEVEGNYDVGAVTGVNKGIIENVCVLNANVIAKNNAGGAVGTNEGDILGVTVATGNHKISAIHTLGGIVGKHKGHIEKSSAACNVEAYIPQDNSKIYTNGYGRYVGGAIGYAEGGASAKEVYTGVIFDNNGLPSGINSIIANKNSFSKVTRSKVTGIGYLGGVVGEVAADVAQIEKLYNYSTMQVIYVSTAEKTLRGENTYLYPMYRYYGGIVGRVQAGVTLKDCVNFSPVDLYFVENGEAVDKSTIATYITVSSNAILINNPEYVGGITGYNSGNITNCSSSYKNSLSREQEFELQNVRVAGTTDFNLGWYVGGLVGYNDGNIKFDTSFDNKYMNVTVQSYRYAGGIVGYQTSVGSVNNVSGEVISVGGTVSSTFERAGGIVGSLDYGTISGSYNNDAYVFGATAGGITAYLKSGVTLYDCSNTGEVYGRGPTTTYSGGIVATNYGTVENCTNTGIVSIYFSPELNSTLLSKTSGDVGGVVAYNAGKVKNCHSKANANHDNYIAGSFFTNIGGLVGRNIYNATYKGEIINDETEEININIWLGYEGNVRSATTTAAGGVLGTGDGQLTISNFIYSGYIQNNSNASLNIRTGVGGIAGFLNQNQRISNCVMMGCIDSNEPYNGGIAGYYTGGIIESTNEVTKYAIIKGKNYTGGVVGICNCTDNISKIELVKNSAYVEGVDYVGGLIGYVNNEKYISISNSKNTGDIVGRNYIGGLLGNCVNYVDNSYTSCINEGKITGKQYVGGIIGKYDYKNISAIVKMSDSYSNNDIRSNATSSAYVGGLIGNVSGLLVLENCSNSGNIGALDDISTYKASNVGGIIGKTDNSLELYECSNTGDISATTYCAGLVGYASKKDGKYIFEDCSNDANISGTTYCAGLVAAISTTATTKGTQPGITVFSSCRNRGNVDGTMYLGGLVSSITETRFDIKNCKNYADFGKNITGVTGSVGGMIGYATNTLANLECSIKNCSNRGSFYNLRALQGLASNAGVAAGMIATAGIDVKIENCTNGWLFGDEIMSFSTASGIIGGMIGFFAPEKNLEVTNSSNYMNIIGTNNGTYIGGLVGYSCGKIKVGEKDTEASYSSNYGLIDSTKTLSYVGGAIGYAASSEDYSIYGYDNFADIGNNSIENTNIGGIIGRATYTGKAMANVTIEDCSQKANIYNAKTNIGGIVGKIDTYNIEISNCINGDLDNYSVGIIDGKYVTENMGGIIGGIASSVAVSIKNSFNYGEIGDSESAVCHAGGIVGRLTIGSNIPGTVDIIDCTQYGKIKNVRNYVGGIIGHHDYHTLNIINCNNGDSSIEDSGSIYLNSGTIQYVGGLIGFSGEASQNYETYREKIIENSNNYGDIICQDATATLNEVGGLIGYDKFKTIIGNVNDATKTCNNYGDIEGCPNTRFCQVGGIIGNVSCCSAADNSVWMYDVTNYGDIGEKALRLRHTAGIIGYNLSDIRLFRCVNLGQMYGFDVFSASNAGCGGILGYSAGNLKETYLFNCVNGKKGSDTFGKITVNNDCGSVGGIVGGLGYNNAKMKFYMYDCTNYAPIEISGTAAYIGNILGRTSIGIDALMYNVVNKGKFTYSGTKLEYYGGIIGLHNGNGLNLKKVINDEHVVMSFDFGRSLYVGGLVGYASGTESVIFGGTNDDDSTDFELACTNNGEFVFKQGTRVDYIGNVIGYGNELKVYGTTNKTDIVFEEGVVASCVGGIAGRTAGECLIQDCTQLGQIINVGYSSSNYGTAGGIVCYSSGSIKLLRCINGKLNDDNAGKINTKVWKWEGLEYQPSRVGGILGGSSLTVEIVDCSNYGDIYVEGTANYFGGVVGLTYRDCIITNTINYGDIICEGALNQCGGIAGSMTYTAGVNTCKTIIGDENDTTKKCINYGNIYVNNTSTTQYVGGILGVASQSLEMYDAENNGKLTIDNEVGKVYYIGGVLGYNSNSIKLVNDINNGEIVLTGNITGCGGISGYVANQLVANNCVNNANITVNGIIADVGGTVGYTGSTGIVYLTECVNSGDIVANGNATSIGGNVGGLNIANSVVDGCINNGQITLKAVGNYTGGIVGNFVSSTIKNSINNGVITVNAKNNYCGGIAGYSTGETTTIDSTNNGDIVSNANAIYIGGIFGSSGTTIKTNISGCTNNATISSKGTLSECGGIGGWFKTLMISECDNTGDIISENTLSTCGGIIGNVANITITECNNSGNITSTLKGTYIGGIVGTSSDSEIYLVNNVGNINCLDVANNLGGILGYATRLTTMIDNLNEGNITVQKNVEYVGGMIGYSNSSQKLENCINKGNIKGFERIVGIGGLIGNAAYASGKDGDYIYIGSKDDISKACFNYGTIVGVGTKEDPSRNIGGIIGRATLNVYIYDAANYGEIGDDNSYIANIGGIIGNLESSSKVGVSEIASCYENASIINAIYDVRAAYVSGVGSIVGRITPDGIVKDCSNDASKIITCRENIASVGGIVGYAPGALTIKSCINNMPIICNSDSMYIGGIIGRTTTSPIFLENVVNTRDITFNGGTVSYVGGLVGYASAGISIGALNDDEVDTTKICKNTGKLIFKNACKADIIGNIAGYTGNAKIYGITNEQDIIPEEDSVISVVGGIVGQMTGESTVVDCVNLGKIKNVVYDGNAATAGGIVASVQGTPSIIRCTNGSVEDEDAGLITVRKYDNGTIVREPNYVGGIIGYTKSTLIIDETSNYGNIILYGKSSNIGGFVGYAETNLKITHGRNYGVIQSSGEMSNVGGLVGASYANPLIVTDCTNRGDILSEITISNVGGIVGNSTRTDVYEVCENYGNIKAKNGLSNAGGIIGCAIYSNAVPSERITIGNENDATRRCINAGNIIAGGSGYNRNIGGIIGISTRAVSIYNAKNIGNIGNDVENGYIDGYFTNVSGIAGNVAAYSKNYVSDITECIQEGNIDRVCLDTRGAAYVSGCGGIVGYASSKLTLNSCENKEGTIIKCLDKVQNIGGYVGYSTADVDVTNCVNNTQFVFEGGATCVGGVVGYSSALLTIKNCNNNVDIVPNGAENYIGGIIGRTIDVDIDITNCINYGNIGNGSFGAESVGGIVGSAYGKKMHLADCTNKGNVLIFNNDKAVKVTNIGGIAGMYRHKSTTVAEVNELDISNIILENCLNEGNVGREGVMIPGSYIGGICGTANGNIRYCTNLGKIYAGNVDVGGAVGRVYGATKECNLTKLVNGDENIPDSGQIKICGTANSIGGIVGTSENAIGYKYNLIINECTNIGNIILETGLKNTYIGGIYGRKSAATASKNNTVTISDCMNYGNIENAYMYAGGIAGSSIYGDGLMEISKSINYGNITAIGKIGNDTSYGYIGGIVGFFSTHGGITECINAGNIMGEINVGGLAGHIGYAGTTAEYIAYMHNSYNLGDVSLTSSNVSYGGLIGTIGKGKAEIIDCYTNDEVIQIWPNVANNGVTSEWTYKDNTLDYGYLTEEVFDNIIAGHERDDLLWSDERSELADTLMQLLNFYNTFAGAVNFLSEVNEI